MSYVRNDVINAFDKNIFSYKVSKSKTKEEESKEKLGEKSEEELKGYINNIFTFIEGESKDINNDLFAKYLNFSKPIDLAKKLYETKDANENSELVEEIKNRWSNLKDETKKMCEKK